MFLGLTAYFGLLNYAILREILKKNGKKSKNNKSGFRLHVLRLHVIRCVWHFRGCLLARNQGDPRVADPPSAGKRVLDIKNG